MKYKILESDFVLVGQIKLYRIQATKSFQDVKRGDLGGFIQKYDNLSQEGDAWVSDDACVSGDAQVYGNARVYGNAKVTRNASVFCNARVFGNAEVFGNAQVYVNAEVYGNALVYGNARVCGNAVVSGDACVYGNAEVTDNAKVTGKVININGYRQLITKTDHHLKVGCKMNTFAEWRELLNKDEYLYKDELPKNEYNTVRALVEILVKELNNEDS